MFTVCVTVCLLYIILV